MSFRPALLLGALLLGAVCGIVYATQFYSSGGRQTALFGGVSLSVELATTPEARKQGLGGRTVVPEGYGMLFVFPQSGRHGFWMKDTLVPLDIFWLDSQGHVVSMALDVATSTFPNVFYPSQPASYVLETAAGFGRMHAIATGTPLELKNLELVSQ